MKRLLFIIALCVVTQGQTKLVEYKLNPDASKTFQELTSQEQEIVRQATEALQSIGRQKQALLIGAGVPRAELAKFECNPLPKGEGEKAAIIICAPRPEAAVKAAPSPSPKS